MIRRVRLPLRFDAEALLAEARALGAELWKPHFQTLHYEGGWTALPLRSPGGRADDIIPEQLRGEPYADTPLLDACPRLREALGAFRCPLKSVRLMRLAPGAEVKTHRDVALHLERNEARLHVPLLTHPGVEFVLDGERLGLAPGECWYLNFDLPHSVRNPGPGDRIHLVVDAAPDDWLRARLDEGDQRRDMDPLERHTPEERRAMIDHLRRMGTPTALRRAEDLERRLAGLSSGGQ